MAKPTAAAKSKTAGTGQRTARRGKGRRAQGNGESAGARRREEMFREALRLFRERGYHATGINDIGAAVGLTGPAFYRHFASKDDLLAEAILAGARVVAAATREALELDLPPRESLEALVRSYIEVAANHRDMIAVYTLESRFLPDDQRQRLNSSVRRFAQSWRDVLMRVAPEIDAEQARVRVRGAMFMVTSLCLDNERTDILEIMTQMVLGALLGPSPYDLRHESTDSSQGKQQ